MVIFILSQISTDLLLTYEEVVTIKCKSATFTLLKHVRAWLCKRTSHSAYVCSCMYIRTFNYFNKFRE